ncbi:STML1-like protein [Mya arenaria]|uniref:STML1-like protein n=1 Tax=Mya arenaria TaxID=6604 RepID=A0ABY7EKT3_MYAAR|nr:stomatin-like protein 1 isoform X2 [Mya arenaria]WAR09351.1 STML1-like protein [Mya arenaria]
MAAKYTRLSTEDPDRGQRVTFDFSSYNAFGTGEIADKNYKSIFSYGLDDKRMAQNGLSVSVVKEPLLSRVCRYLITVLCVLFCIATFPISAIFVIKTVSECERLVVFRLGRLQKVKGPGVNFVLPCIDRVKKVDMRIKAFNVPPIQLITTDAGIIELGADVYFRITDAIKSVTNVQDMNTSLRGLVRNSVMNSLTKHDLQDIENKQIVLMEQVKESCNNTAVPWGVVLERIQLSPIKVLQAAKDPGILPGLGGQGGISQVFQQLTQSLFPDMAPSMTTKKQEVNMETVAMGDADGAVGCEDVAVEVKVTPGSLVDLVRGVLGESLVRAVGATYQFKLSGPSGGTFYLDLSHGTGSVGQGPDPRGNPDVTLELTTQDMQRMFSGNLKPLSAYMSGRLRVTGDLSAATRLEEVMERIINKSNSSTVAGHTVVNI